MKHILTLLTAITIAAATLCSCRSSRDVVVIPTTVAHDTIDRLVVQHDSIHILDSLVTIVTYLNDTVYQTRDRWRIEYRDRYLHDSVYIARTDTLTVTVHEVTNQLTHRQRIEVFFGRAFLVLLFLSIIWAVIAYKRR